MPKELTEDDLEVAEASVKFALENCPVEGLLSTHDGSPVSFDALQALLDRLAEAESSPGAAPGLSREELSQLEAVAGYTYENCPLDGAIQFHDGRRISGRNSEALVAKVRELLATHADS